MNFTSARRTSLNLSDVKKIKSHGSLLVAQSRLRSMAKWIWLIISAAIANPILYLISIGIGVGSFIDKSAGPAGIDGVKYLTFLAP